MADLIKIKSKRGPKPGTRREKEESVTDSPLMPFLAGEARNRGHKPYDLASHLGIGYAYLTQLLRGLKPVNRISRKTLIAAAKYLDVPVAQVYLWAGAIQPEDFIHESKFEMSGGDIYTSMRRHPQFGGFMPNEKEWAALPKTAKLIITLLFESVTGETLTSKTLIPPESMVETVETQTKTDAPVKKTTKARMKKVSDGT